MNEVVERIEIKDTKTLWEREIGSTRVSRKEFILDGKPVLITVVISPPEANFAWRYDPRFDSHPIELEAGGLLIDQQKTKEKWGGQAGALPEKFLDEFDKESLAFCPTNWGWQREAFGIDSGELVSIVNDRKELSGRFDVIGLTPDGWTQAFLTLKEGRVEEDDQVKFKIFKVGFSMPLILNEGRVIPPEEIINDPRLLADLRNVVDFGAGKPLPSEFWLNIRGLLPTGEVAGKRLIKGRTVVTRREGALTQEEMSDFEKIIEEHGISRWLRIDTRRGAPRLAIVEKLPLNRIPVLGVGFNREKDLIVVAVDGRQEGTHGATIEQLAELMKKEGAVTVGLGSAGGDVALIAKTRKGIEILNYPSNKDRKTRLVPGVLVVSS